MMHHLFLVRHGESVKNISSNYKGGFPDPSVPLTSEGHDQASAVGEFLAKYLQFTPKDDIIIEVSPYMRALQTMARILQHVDVKSVKEDALLSELQYGIFGIFSELQVKQEFPDELAKYERIHEFSGDYYTKMPEGESPFDCEIRQKLWLDGLYRRMSSGHCPGNIIVIGHSCALTLLRKAIFNYTADWFKEEPIPSNCSVQHILLDEHSRSDQGYIYGGPTED